MSFVNSRSTKDADSHRKKELRMFDYSRIDMKIPFT